MLKFDNSIEYFEGEKLLYIRVPVLEKKLAIPRKEKLKK